MPHLRDEELLESYVQGSADCWMLRIYEGSQQHQRILPTTCRVSMPASWLCFWRSAVGSERTRADDRMTFMHHGVIRSRSHGKSLAC